MWTWSRSPASPPEPPPLTPFSSSFEGPSLTDHDVAPLRLLGARPGARRHAGREWTLTCRNTTRSEWRTGFQNGV